MSIMPVIRFVLRLLPPVLISPFFACVGLLVVLRAIMRLALRVVRSRWIFASSLRCPQRHLVPAVGRWGCGTCHTDYLGWIGRCPTCGAGADATCCPVCGVGVRLPWETP